jgi:hypothetical protein
LADHNRNEAVDCQKGFLTLFMILCHCIQFFGYEDKPIQGILVDYINLTTFSGFFFCFGYAADLAYFQREFKHSVGRMAKNAGKLLVAFYISGIAYDALAENKIFRTDHILDIILIQRYPGWSEFLVSFAGIMLIGILLFPVFKRMNLKIFAVCFLISIAACFFPYEKQGIPQLALFIGSTKEISFPCIQYLVYFGLGILVSRKKWLFKKVLLAACLLINIPVVWYYLQHHELPGRFPPDWRYITGAFFFVYLYYIIFSYLSHWKDKIRVVRLAVQYFSEVGRNSLFYLLISNLLIFAFSGSAFSYRDLNYVIGFYLFLICFIPYLQRLIRSRKMV